MIINKTLNIHETQIQHSANLDCFGSTSLDLYQFILLSSTIRLGMCLVQNHAHSYYQFATFKLEMNTVKYQLSSYLVIRCYKYATFNLVIYERACLYECMCWGVLNVVDYQNMGL